MYNRRMPVTYETETPLAPRGDLGPYRQADYLALPDEPRCELLYGRLLMMAAPTLRHQISARSSASTPTPGWWTALSTVPRPSPASSSISRRSGAPFLVDSPGSAN
jgi:hypothetical protein